MGASISASLSLLSASHRSGAWAHAAEAAKTSPMHPMSLDIGPPPIEGASRRIECDTSPPPARPEVERDRKDDDRRGEAPDDDARAAQENRDDPKPDHREER